MTRNRDIAERIFTDVLSSHDMDRISEYYTEDCQLHGLTGPEAIDVDEYEAFLSMYFEAFPDLTFEIDELLAEDDRVAVRWTAQGTHEESLMDIPATGRSVAVTGMTVLHFEDGKVVETYNNQDILGLLEQLDAIPDSPRNIVRLLVGQMKSRLTDR